MKRRTKPESQYKIDFKAWELAIKSSLESDIGLSEELCAMVVESIHRCTAENLLCSKCGRVLPDEEFYKQKAQFTRRYRSNMCRSCWLEVYTKPKKINEG